MDTPRLLVYVALNLAIGGYLIYEGINTWRDPLRQMHRGMQATLIQIHEKLSGGKMSRQLEDRWIATAKPSAVIIIGFGIWCIALAFLPFIIPF